MAYLLGSIPVLELVIENPFTRTLYPTDGTALGVIDTGFEGFLLIPWEIFTSLGFNELTLDERELVMADSHRVRSHGTYGKAILPSLGLSFEGFIETIKGVDEIVVGTELLENLSLTVDHCTRRVEVRACSSP